MNKNLLFPTMERVVLTCHSKVIRHGKEGPLSSAFHKKDESLATQRCICLVPIYSASRRDSGCQGSRD